MCQHVDAIALVRRVPTCAALVSSLWLLPLPQLAEAAWTTNGVPLATAPGHQRTPRLAADGSDGVYVAWVDERPVSGGVFLTRVDGNGSVYPNWTPALRLSSDKEAVLAECASDGTGGVTIAWSSPDSSIHLQRYGGSGLPAPGWPSKGLKIGAAGEVSRVVVVADNYRGVLLSYYTHPSPMTLVRHVTSLDTAAVIQWAWTTSLSSTQPDQFRMKGLASDLAHGAYVVAVDDLSPSPIMHVERIDSTGVPAAGWPYPGYTIAMTSSLVDAPHVVPGLGDVLITWNSEAFDDRHEVFAARLLSSGVSAPLPWQATGISFGDGMTNQVRHRVAPTSSGLLVAWEDIAAQSSLMAASISRTGTKGFTFPIAASLFPQVLEATLPHPSGDALVVWSEDRSLDSGSDLYAQRVNTDGSVWIPSGGVPICTAPLAQDQVSAARSEGTIFVAWRDQRAEQSDLAAGTDIYVAKITDDGVVPARVSIVSVNATAASVELNWHSALGPWEFIVERVTTTTPWSVIGRVERDALGSYSFTDFDVASGLIGYRLREPTGAVASTETWVQVPQATPLQINGFLPGQDRTAVSLYLSSSKSARLAVFDVSGRRIDSLDIVAARPGQHTVSLGRALTVGLYFLRLTQADEQVSALRAVIR